MTQMMKAFKKSENTKTQKNQKTKNTKTQKN